MWRSPYTCLAFLLVLVGCSSSKSNDFFEAPKKPTSSTSTATGLASTSTSGSSTTTGGTVVDDGGATATTGSSGTTGDVGALDTTTGSGGTTATDDASASVDTTTGGTGGTETATSSATPDVDVVVVEIELEPGSDCVEVSCPEEAPHPVECEITFSQPGPDGIACVAEEDDGLLYVQSGTSCYGTEVEIGSITCSSQEPDEPLSTATCVAHNKPNFSVVQDRCDCEADVPGCSAFGFN